MEKTIYALGFFDGVHLGHRALLNQARRLAQAQHCNAGAVTFLAHPDTLVQGQTPVLITTSRERENLLRDYVDTVISLPFDLKMLQTPWEEFLNLLRRDYGAAGFVCGDDFRFGAGGKGTGALLADYCRREQLPCVVVSEQSVHHVRVTSTYIRTLLERGEMAEAVRFLGHPYSISGEVIPGRQLGRTLGIPTANLMMPNGLAVPRFGVYACLVELFGKPYPAVTNIGTRPTVSGHHITVESWILDFAGDLYGKEITVKFYQFLRPEQKFPSLEALQAEVRKNGEEAREYFRQNLPQTDGQKVAK